MFDYYEEYDNNDDEDLRYIPVFKKPFIYKGKPISHYDLTLMINEMYDKYASKLEIELVLIAAMGYLRTNRKEIYKRKRTINDLYDDYYDFKVNVICDCMKFLEYLNGYMLQAVFQVLYLYSEEIDNIIYHSNTIYKMTKKLKKHKEQGGNNNGEL